MKGYNFIGSKRSAEGASTFTATNAATGEILEGNFTEATEVEIEQACAKAAEAFKTFRKTSRSERAAFLRKISENIVALGDELVERTVAESGLPEGRITGERGRTVGQINQFAALIEEGTYLDARIDNGQPERAPLPKADLRYMKTAIGPVAVFGASNFPLAFSTAGGDTASALAAGCPVVVKAHPAHPGCAELVAQAIASAVEECGLPEGVFSMVHGRSIDVGQALVLNADIKAVGFTGSIPAGRAIYNAAASRPEPIPVYAEMGSSNPVFVLPGAIEERAETMASDLAGSVCLGAGQFCTNPGMTVTLKSASSENFVSTVAENLGASPAGTTVHSSIKYAYDDEVASKLSVEGVNLASRSTAVNANTETSVQPLLMSCDAETFQKEEVLKKEVFGPTTLAVSCSSKEEMLQLAADLEGHLTATVHASGSDYADFSELFEILETKVGRIIINQYPTGVEVCPSMQHGGPYPASTDSRTTSVGTAAIDRYVRPVSYQNYPQELLPEELRDGNPAGIWRTVDGSLTK